MFRKPYRGYYTPRRLFIAGVVAASGAISATTPIVFGQSASATGTASLTATEPVLFGESAQLTAQNSNVTATEAVVFGESAQLTGTGALASVSDVAGVTFVFNSAEPSDDDHGRLSTIADLFVSDFNFSVEMWVKPSDAYPYGTVAGGGNDAATNWASEDPTPTAPNDPYGGGSTWQYMNWIIDGNNNTDVVDGTFSCGVYGSGRVRGLIGDGTNLVWLQPAVTGDVPSIVDDQWHQIVIGGRESGVNDIDYELWVDGAIQDSVTITNGRTDFDATFWTGNSWATFPASQGNWTFGAEKLSSLNLLDHQPDFKGDYTALTLWDVAPTSVAARYASGPTGIAGTESNLISYYPFDEGTGTTASDDLTNSGDITFYLGATETAPTWATVPAPLVGFSSSTQLTATGALDSTEAVVFGESAVLSNAGALAGTATTGFGESAQLTGNGELTSTTAVTFLGSLSTTQESEEAYSGGFWFGYDLEYRHRQKEEEERKKRREKVKRLKDKIDREIAERLQKEENEQDRINELKRLADLVEKNKRIILAQTNEKVVKAANRVIKQKNYSAMEALERELKMLKEEELFLIEATKLLVNQ